MSTATKRRLIKDFKKIQTDAPKGISGSPDPNNLHEWTAVIFG